MQQNKHSGPKRPVLVEKNHTKNHGGQGQRSRTTVSQQQRMNAAAHQATQMANKKGPTIQERAEQHRREQQQELAQPHIEEKPRAKKKKTKAPAKKPSLLSHIFVTDRAVVGAPDFLIMEVVAALLVFGLIMVFSASSYRSLLEYGSAYSYFIRQLAYAIVGVVGMLMVMLMQPELFRKAAPPVLFVILLLLIYTLFNGEESLGATRWVTIAGIRFQPSEMAKPLMVICTADLIKNSPYDVVKSRNNILVFLMLLATFVVIAAEDLGSAVAIFGGCFAMFIVAGLSRRGIAGVFAIGFAAVIGFCIAEPYRVQRLFGFLSQTDADAASGSAYQLVQSLYAFGSGGLFGVGLGNSGQKLLYLPGMHTDFIYSVIGEEFGIVGAMLVLSAFMLFAYRGFWLATRIEDPFKSYLAFGAAAIISVQALINMGVAVGVLPVTGITLPLISYGGTSLVVTLLSVGLLLNMSRYADREKEKQAQRSKRKRRKSKLEHRTK